MPVGIIDACSELYMFSVSQVIGDEHTIYVIVEFLSDVLLFQVCLLLALRAWI